MRSRVEHVTEKINKYIRLLDMSCRRFGNDIPILCLKQKSRITYKLSLLISQTFHELNSCFFSYCDSVVF